MKFRSTFVTNSSSSSYVCEICGRTESGWDLGLSECEMMECINGHVFCCDEALEMPSKEENPFLRFYAENGQRGIQNWCFGCRNAQKGRRKGVFGAS